MVPLYRLGHVRTIQLICLYQLVLTNHLHLEATCRASYYLGLDSHAKLLASIPTRSHLEKRLAIQRFGNRIQHRLLPALRLQDVLVDLVDHLLILVDLVLLLSGCIYEIHVIFIFYLIKVDGLNVLFEHFNIREATFCLTLTCKLWQRNAGLGPVNLVVIFSA